MKSPLICTVLAVDEKTVHLRVSPDQTIHLPLEAMHGTPIPHGTVRLMATIVEGGQVDDSVFAKMILNELLSPPRA